MSVFILLIISAGHLSYAGEYSSKQACEIAGIEAGAMMGQAAPKFVCVKQ